MPLCPQITNTPVTVTQTADFTVTSVVPAVADTKDGLAQEFTDIVVDLDGKTKAYYQTTAPTSGMTEGDIWFDIDDGNKQYYYNGTAWVSVQDTAIAAAQAAATAAQTTADGKNRIYRQTSQPTGGTYVEGDLWFDTDDGNKIYRYTSGSWSTAVELGNSAISSLSANKLTAGTIDASVITVSNINAGNISTGTLAADRIAAASITGTKIAAGTITASNIAANTITATQIAAGTITATEINSAYVYAGSITASQITAGTLTGFTIQTNSDTGSGTTSIIMSGANNAIQFRVSGTISGNIVPLGTAGILMHYGSTPDGTGSTYPKVQMSSNTALLAASSSYYVQATTSGCSINGNLQLFNALQVDGNATFNGLMYAPNLGTSSSATNLRVATGSIGEITETSASSIRFKENVVDVNTVFDIDPKKLLDLPVRAFSYKEGYLSENDDRVGAMLPGFIAEEVDAIYPIAADYGQDGPQSWNDRFIIPGLLALIQDLYKEIKLLKGE